MKGYTYSKRRPAPHANFKNTDLANDILDCLAIIAPWSKLSSTKDTTKNLVRKVHHTRHRGAQKQKWNLFS